MKEIELAEQRNVAEPRLRSAIDRELFGALERAVDDGDVDLEREPRAETVTADDLGDRAVEILPGRIIDFLAVELEGAEVSEFSAIAT